MNIDIKNERVMSLDLKVGETAVLQACGGLSGDLIVCVKDFSGRLVYVNLTKNIIMDSDINYNCQKIEVFVTNKKV